MRVEVSTIEDFIAEVRESLADGGTLMENCVRFRIDTAPQQVEAISFDVAYHATAVIQHPEESRDRYLLDLTRYCGTDEPGDEEGTDRAVGDRDRLTREMAELGVKVRRGKVEVI